MATTEPCCGFPNSTHYAGCTCHENGWAMRLAAAEAERDRLQEKLDQFDAHGMPNVAAALDRIAAAEARALCLEGERDGWQRSAEIVEARLAEATGVLREIAIEAPPVVRRSITGVYVTRAGDLARAYLSRHAAPTPEETKP